MIDSHDVAASLKATVFPVLREAGFVRFKARAAWRFREHVIEVVDFRSPGSYLRRSESRRAAGAPLAE
jgi:hypothetical protein